MPSSVHPWDPICPVPRGLVRPAVTDPHGLVGPTPGRARGPKWRCTTPGFFVPADVTDELPEQRVLEQSMRLPTGGAVTAWAACRLWRAAFFDGLMPDGRTRRPVPLAIGPVGHLRHLPGSTILRDRLDPREVVLILGIPCTARRRALFDEMRHAPDLRDAVVAMDMMAAAEQVSISQMHQYAATRAGWNGVAKARAALDLADERSKSPNETRVRLIWVLDAGLPSPLVNRPVWDLDGRLLGIADLLDEEAGMVVEFDGAEHRRARRHASDVAREDRMRRVGLEYVKVTGLDVPRRDLVVDRLLSSRARARHLPPDQRRWSTAPPPGWRPEPTLDDLFDLRARNESRADSWPA